MDQMRQVAVVRYVWCTRICIWPVHDKSDLLVLFLFDIWWWLAADPLSEYLDQHNGMNCTQDCHFGRWWLFYHLMNLHNSVIIVKNYNSFSFNSVLIFHNLFLMLCYDVEGWWRKLVRIRSRVCFNAFFYCAYNLLRLIWQDNITNIIRNIQKVNAAPEQVPEAMQGVAVQ